MSLHQESGVNRSAINANAFFGLKYISLYERSGYGESARRYLLGLADTGIPLTWCPMVQGTSWDMSYQPSGANGVGDPALDPFCNKAIDYNVVIVHTVPEYYPRWRTLEKNKSVWGYTTWETDKLPDHWPALLNQMDGILVPCEWNREVFAQSGVTVPIRVVPHIAMPLDQPETFSIDSVNEGDFVFYSINTWTARKNLSGAVHAYLSAFTADDAAVFVIRTSPNDSNRSNNGIVRFIQNKFPPSTEQALRKVVRQYPNPARIVLLTDELSDTEINGLHARGDCYLSLSHGEGWGLGAFDAGSWGKPVIMTAYGGPLEYLSEDLAYLVDFDSIAVHDPAGKRSYSSSQTWAEPKKDHAVKLIREVYESREIAKRKGTALQNSLARNFNSKRITGVLLDILSETPRSGLLAL